MLTSNSTLLALVKEINQALDEYGPSFILLVKTDKGYSRIHVECPQGSNLSLTITNTKGDNNFYE